MSAAGAGKALLGSALDGGEGKAGGGGAYPMGTGDECTPAECGTQATVVSDATPAGPETYKAMWRETGIQNFEQLYWHWDKSGFKYKVRPPQRAAVARAFLPGGRTFIFFNPSQEQRHEPTG